jgi:hypothetical protein
MTLVTIFNGDNRDSAEKGTGTAAAQDFTCPHWSKKQWGQQWGQWGRLFPSCQAHYCERPARSELVGSAKP